jgi:hypothetical protein
MGSDKSHGIPSEKLNQPMAMVRYYLVGHRSNITRAVSLVRPCERIKVSAGPLVSKCKFLAFYQSSIAEMNLCEAFCENPFASPPNNAKLGYEVVQALFLSSQVRARLLPEACVRSFALSGTSAVHSLRRILSGGGHSNG